MKTINQPQDPLVQSLAEAIWQRIRFLAKSWVQYDSFVHLGAGLMPSPEDAEPQSAAESSGVMDANRLALDFILLSLQDALETENFRILVSLADAGELSLSRLADLLATNELTLQERLSGLLLSGLVDKNYDHGTYVISEAGKQLAELIRNVQSRVAAIIQSELPSILGNPDNE